jgi:hypothetical protein
VSDNKALNAFESIFRGNNLFFTKHQAPFELVEGKMKSKWCGFSVYNKRNPPPAGKEERDLIPLTFDHYRDHLNGGDGLAVSPVMNVEDAEGNILKRNVCYFAVIDTDVYGIDYLFLINKLYTHGFKFIPILSKSGGLHIYFVFDNSEPADKVIETLSKVVSIFGMDKRFRSEKNICKVEIFPKQATFVPGDKNANCIFLPFYNSADPKNTLNKMLTPNGKLVGLIKALPIIEEAFTNLKEINDTIDKLPYDDAPYCIQAILLSGALSVGDSRNCFLFSSAIYLKKKYTDDFYDELVVMNDCLENPIDREELDNIFTSIKKNNYDNYWCSKSPLKEYCNKGLCKLREYAPEKEKNNRFTGAASFGDIKKIVDGKGDTQYYKWAIRVKEDDDYADVILDSEDEIYSQGTIQKKCLRYLHWSPFMVSQNDWIKLVNKSMEFLRNNAEGSVEVIAKGTETSDKALLRNAIYRFLTHKQVQNKQKSFIKAGQVYKEEGIYYFTTDGLLRYLNLEKIPLHKVNLHADLTKYKFEEGEIVYNTSKGVELRIPCWIKKEDDELKEMDTFYEDIYSDEEDTEQENEKEVDDGDINF